MDTNVTNDAPKIVEYSPPVFTIKLPWGDGASKHLMVSWSALQAVGWQFEGSLVVYETLWKSGEKTFPSQPASTARISCTINSTHTAASSIFFTRFNFRETTLNRTRRRFCRPWFNLGNGEGKAALRFNSTYTESLRMRKEEKSVFEVLKDLHGSFARIQSNIFQTKGPMPFTSKQLSLNHASPCSTWRPKICSGWANIFRRLSNPMTTGVNADLDFSMDKHPSKQSWKFHHTKWFWERNIRFPSGETSKIQVFLYSNMQMKWNKMKLINESMDGWLDRWIHRLMNS